VRRYKVGYEIRTELWKSHPNDKPCEIKAAYTHNGDYIGSSKNAHFLCKKRGIKPEKADSNNCVCSIGFCKKEQKYYGWSHRALCGFGIGDKIFQDRFGNDHTLFTKHGSVTIKTLEDAKKAAISFARYVS